MFKVRDLSVLSQKKATPIAWLIENILPLGILGDVYSMPDTGKTTLILSLCVAIANGNETWHGYKIASGRVAYVGGEKSNDEVWIRDLKRAGANVTESGTMVNYDPDNGLWFWNKKTSNWEETKDFKPVMDHLKVLKPVLVVLDTVSLLAIGSEPTDTLQQVLLANRILAIKEELDTTILSISHTNQSSMTDKLERRLHYTSRAGSNGYPGRVRWLMGLTNLSVEEKNVLKIDTLRKIVAMAVSKHNEMAQPKIGNMFKPILFELCHDGQIVMLEESVKTEDLNEALKFVRTKKKEEKIKTTHKEVIVSKEVILNEC